MHACDVMLLAVAAWPRHDEPVADECLGEEACCNDEQVQHSTDPGVGLLREFRGLYRAHRRRKKECLGDTSVSRHASMIAACPGADITCDEKRNRPAATLFRARGEWD